MTTSLGDRMLKVDHAGEHGAVNIYRAQVLVSRLTAPGMTGKLREFLAHEQRHRALFAERLRERDCRRCRSYWLCGAGGYVLGFTTALLGRNAIAATTHAVESVVLQHLQWQMDALHAIDRHSFLAIADIVAEEREHHDHGVSLMEPGSLWASAIAPVVRFSTESVIWLGMRL